MKQSKLEKPRQKREKDLVILATMLKSLKKLKIPTIKLFERLKELYSRSFCRVKIEKTFFKIKTSIELC